MGKTRIFGIPVGRDTRANDQASGHDAGLPHDPSHTSTTSRAPSNLPYLPSPPAANDDPTCCNTYSNTALCNDSTPCYIGIDLGTSCSGYSYAFDNNPAHIKMPLQWPGDRRLEVKTSTALLYEVQPDGTWQCIEWGTQAVNKFTLSRNAAEKQHWRLLEGKQFKMALADSLAGFPAAYKLPTDCPLSPQQIITDMLSCLRKHATDHLHDSAGLDLATADVQYCLSVPAGWSPIAKDTMKQAAEDAGLKLYQSAAGAGEGDSSSGGSSLTSRSLPQLAAADPALSDAAAAHRSAAASKSVDLDRLSKQSIGSSSSSWLDASAVTLIHEQEAAAVTACWDPYRSWGGLRAVPGSVWMVVDAGGGTVDIAMHQIEAGAAAGEAQLSEVLESACLPWGSSMVDRHAEQLLLRPLFESDQHYEQWRAADPASFMRQMLKWEDVKKEFNGHNDVWLEFLNPLLECLPAARPERSGGGMYLKASTMKQVFDPILHHILEQVKHMVTQKRTTDGRSGADVLLLCGGFGSSEYLRRQLEKTCGKHIGKIVSPVDAQKAVVLGNTTHLMRPRSVIARCSRLTYGVRCCHEPNPSCATAGQLMPGPKGDNTLCMAHFKRMVQAGEVVRLEQMTEPWRLTPLPGADSVILEVFATEEDNAAHVTEPHMHKVGDVTLKVKKQPKKFVGWTVGKQASADYAIDVCFMFGAAEIHVEAHDVSNKQKVSTRVRFSSEPAAGPVVLPAGAS